MTTPLVLDCLEMTIWTRTRDGVTDLAGPGGTRSLLRSGQRLIPRYPAHGQHYLAACPLP